ncbi:MAG: SLC13 family permease, partial [Geminicoccaceae bacterium]
MNGDMILVFALLAAAVALFASNRVRLDVVAVGLMLALILCGILSPREALAGFAEPVVVMITALFIIGEGLVHTGIALSIGRWLVARAGSSEVRLLVLLMAVVALLSAFMSSTGAVAIFVPIALSLAGRIGVDPARLLMPVAFASLIGGMLTLIGTPPNLIVSTELTRNGLEGFGFFAFTPIGGVILLIGIGYMLLVGRHVLSSGAAAAPSGGQGGMRVEDLAAAYRLRGRMHRLRVLSHSRAAERTVAEARLRAE